MKKAEAVASAFFYYMYWQILTDVPNNTEKQRKSDPRKKYIVVR